MDGDAGHGRVVVGVADRREAQPRAQALLVVEGQLVNSGGDDVPVRREVAGVQTAAGAAAAGPGAGVDEPRPHPPAPPAAPAPRLLELALVLARRLVGVLGGPVAVALGVLLLELARVEQHQRRELDRAAGGVDGPVEALGHDVRDQAAVVQMGVGQDDRVEARRVVGERARGCARPRAGCPGTCRSR